MKKELQEVTSKKKDRDQEFRKLTLDDQFKSKRLETLAQENRIFREERERAKREEDIRLIQMKAELDGLKASNKRQEKEIVSLKRAAQDKDEWNLQLQEQQQGSLLALKQAKEEFQKKESERISFQEHQQALSALQNEKDGQLQLAEKRIAQLMQEHQQALSALQTQKNGQLEFAEKRIAQKDLLIEARASLLKKEKEKCDQLQKEKDQAEEGVRPLKEQNASLVSQLNEKDKEISQLKSGSKEKSQQILDLNQALDGVNTKIAKMKAAQKQMQAAFAQVG